MALLRSFFLLPVCPHPSRPHARPCLTIKYFGAWGDGFYLSLVYPAGPGLWSPEVKSWAGRPLDYELRRGRGPLLDPRPIREQVSGEVPRGGSAPCFSPTGVHWAPPPVKRPRVTHVLARAARFFFPKCDLRCVTLLLWNWPQPTTPMVPRLIQLLLPAPEGSGRTRAHMESHGLGRYRGGT